MFASVHRTCGHSCAFTESISLHLQILTLKSETKDHRTRAHQCNIGDRNVPTCTEVHEQNEAAVLTTLIAQLFGALSAHGLEQRKKHQSLNRKNKIS